jgi:hypothetical protein
MNGTVSFPCTANDRDNRRQICGATNLEILLSVRRDMAFEKLPHYLPSVLIAFLAQLLDFRVFWEFVRWDPDCQPIVYEQFCF